MLIWFSDGCGTLQRVSQYQSGMYSGEAYRWKIWIEGRCRRRGHNGITRGGQLKPKAGAANKRPKSASPRSLRTMKSSHEVHKSGRRGRYRGTLAWHGWIMKGEEE